MGLDSAIHTNAPTRCKNKNHKLNAVETLLMDTSCRWTALLSGHLVMFPVKYKHYIFYPPRRGHIFEVDTSSWSQSNTDTTFSPSDGHQQIVGGHLTKVRGGGGGKSQQSNGAKIQDHGQFLWP